MGERAYAVGKVLESVRVPLLDADRMIDDARRLLYAHAFQGGAFDDRAEELGCNETARAIASELEGLSLFECLGVLERARMVGWQTAYPGGGPAQDSEVH